MVAQMLLLAVTLTGAGGPNKLVEQIPLSRADLFPANQYLVKSEPVSRDVRRVIHVYVGPQELKGKTFTGDFTRIYGDSSINPRSSTKRRSDMVGLFSIREDPVTKKLVYVVGAYGSMLEDHRLYTFGLALADAREKLYRAADQTRLKLIDAHVRSQDPEMGCVFLWALVRNPKDPNNTATGMAAAMALGLNAKNPKIVEYLLQLNGDRTVPMLVRMKVNDVLRMALDGWAKSPRELKVVKEFFAGSWQESQRSFALAHDPWLGSAEENLVRWLRAMSINHQFSCKQQLDLALRGIANSKRTSRFKEELSAIIPEMSRYWAPKEKPAGFAYLINWIEKRSDAASQFAAVKVLRNFGPFGEAQLKELRRILAIASDDTVARELRVLLRD